MAIVTLEQLQAHLRLTVGSESPLTPEQEDLQLKLDIAEGMVLDYLARPDDADWTALLQHWVDGEVASPAETVPPAVKGAILLQAGELYGFRGDDLDNPKRDATGDLCPAAKACVYRFRDPALR